MVNDQSQRSRLHVPCFHIYPGFDLYHPPPPAGHNRQDLPGACTGSGSKPLTIQIINDQRSKVRATLPGFRASRLHIYPGFDLYHPHQPPHHRQDKTGRIPLGHELEANHLPFKWSMVKANDQRSGPRSTLPKWKIYENR